ncbi:glycoside hydrolase family 15 protein [Acidimangrovimonas sediminis]|uniref:glycoside hydrolase family 15 protein n=1 Tax=Acidimangrovimonas sediminis TaxID=2056283 RepID=UPI000C80366A|nr:glycoside hydrolase family 15 protein [Acidimangrovimonas sediminis]
MSDDLRPRRSGTYSSATSVLKRGYRPIGDYALIGDTRTAALVALDGSIDWFCGPDFDGNAVFSRLIDQYRGGYFEVSLAGDDPAPDATPTRRYDPDAPVLTTRHACDGNCVEVTDFMILPGDLDEAGSFGRTIVRLIEGIEGRSRLRVALTPRGEYGAEIPKLDRDGTGRWWFRHDGDVVVIDASMELSHIRRGHLETEIDVAAGERHYVTLSVTQGGEGYVSNLDEAWRSLDDTRAGWAAKRLGERYDGPFAAEMKASLMTLSLLVHAPTGAVIAAPTMGLPEDFGGIRNYDYRYCWLRDSYFVLNAFLDQGMTDQAGAFFRWLMAASRSSAPLLETLYTVHRDSDIGLVNLRTAEGYRGSAPVQLGNGAATQLQLDAYGSILMTARSYVAKGGRLHPGEALRMVRFGEVVLDQWTLPDNGIWEMPDPRLHHTYSKAMCWAALDCLMDLGEMGAIDDDLSRFRADRDRIRELVLTRAWNDEIGAFAGALGADWLDAAVLLMPRMGMIEADDPRMVATYQKIRERLGNGAHLRRYADGVDGLEGREATFNVCGFWAADYLIRAGRVDEAEAQIRDMLVGANDLGLMSEEYDPEVGLQLGNFPQGLSHAGMIAASSALAEARRGQANEGKDTRAG